MVLESLLNYKTIKNKPLFTFLMGFFYATVGIFLSLFLFKSQAGLTMVFFTSFAAFHFLYYAIREEESYDIILHNERKILAKHWKLIVLFVFLFIGFFAAFTTWSIVLPEQTTSIIFSTQIQTINNINGIATTGAAYKMGLVFSIFLNNIRVMIFAIIFSFIYGAGAIFILAWNASVGGVFIGSFIKSQLAHVGTHHAILLGFLRYAPHGFLEMAAYFVAALAGGIISVAIIRHHFSSKRFFSIIFDSSELILIAIAMLFVAALVEVFVTPNLVQFAMRLVGG